MKRKTAKASVHPQIGQLLVVGFEGKEMSARLKALLSRIQPAGVILFARNIEGPPQTHKLLRDCQACVATPLFICIDMEGGKVDRLRNVTGPAPSAAEVFATGDRRLFRKHGRTIGESCRAVGFNVDLAPVVDLSSEESRKVMGSRAVSGNPKEVIAYAREFLAGLRSTGVLGAIKHFPGLGGANLDTHQELPSVKKPWKKLWDEDLMPYRVLRREPAMVLVGHAAYPAVTRDRTPASLSTKWISDVLRKKIGYRGLVISDDLEMGGVLKAAPVEQAAVEFVRAGGDLCLICHSEERIVAAYEALVKAAEHDLRLRRRVQESASRVLALKKKCAALKRRTPTPTSKTVEKLTRQLWEFGEQVRLESIRREDGSWQEPA